MHHRDQGWPSACGDYTALLTEYQVQIRIATVGKSEANGHAERLMRTIKEEAVDVAKYADFHHTDQSIGRFLDEGYTHKRIHSALGYLPPTEFEEKWVAQQPEPMPKEASALACPTFWGHYSVCINISCLNNVASYIN